MREVNTPELQRIGGASMVDDIATLSCTGLTFELVGLELGGPPGALAGCLLGIGLALAFPLTHPRY